jgi:hypothetical protein
MSLLSFEFSVNHFFFIMIFFIYFIRFFILYLASLEDAGTQVSNKFFNIYIFTISNLMSAVLFCIVKVRSRRKNKKLKKQELSLRPKKDSQTSSKTMNLELIYEKKSPVNKCKLLRRTFVVSVADLSAQYFVFIFYIFFEISRIQIDVVLIFNILSKYILSRLILKTNYYKHHHLSFLLNILCFVLFSLTDIQSMYRNWNTNIIYFICIKIFCTICYSLEDVVGKKALIEEFLSPYAIIFYKGLYELILLIIGSIPFFFLDVNDKNIFSNFIPKLNSFKKILLIFLLMFFNFLYNVLIWIINDRFSPNDLAITMIIEGITDQFDTLIFHFDEFKNHLFESIYKIIIYLILIIGAFIHNEILIINAWGLDEYTKGNLAKKSIEDFKNAHKRSLTQSSFNLEDNRESKDINERNDNDDNILTELSVLPPIEKEEDS